MKGLLKLAGFSLAIILAAGVFLGCDGEGSEETQEPSSSTQNQGQTTEESKTATKEQGEKSFKKVTTFKGNGAKNSDTFTITGEKFKIKYNCSGSLCQAYLKNPNRDWDMELIMNTTESTKDESIFYGAGEYYIESNCMGNYTMQVFDYK